MPGMPWKVIIEILCRLGVKDLLRYRCVSKLWCSLIDGPGFIEKHLSHSIKTNSNTGVILRHCDLYWVDLDKLDSALKLSHPMEDGGGTEVLGSCNGLLALLNSHDDVAIWNPSTRRYRKLTISEIEFPPWFTFCEFIVFGFGYDPMSDDYKVVRIVQLFGKNSDSFDSEVKVYSAKSNSWKRISDFPCYLRYKRGYGVLASNALHWVVSRKPESDLSNLIVAFDLVSEEYHELPQPDYTDEDFFMNVKVLGGCLCLLCNYVTDDPDAEWGSSSDHVDIWVTKEYGVKESWTKMFTVVPSRSTGFFDYVIPLAYLKNGDKVLMDQNGKKFISYDLERKKARNVLVTHIPQDMETIVCVESLVGLNDSDWKISWTKADEKRKMKKKKKKKKQQSSKKESMDDFLCKGFKLVL